MCAAMGLLDEESSADKMQHLNEVFGNGKITGESLKLLVKERWAVRTTTSEAETQLSVMIRLLRLLLGKHTAAAKGCIHGLKLTRAHRRIFHNADKDDPLFLTIFVFLLDCALQCFCKELIKKARGKSSPIRRARSLKKSMAEFIDEELKSFLKMGPVPSLPIPSCLNPTKSRPAQTEGGRRGSGNGGREKNGAGRNQDKLKGTVWMEKYPSPVSAWKPAEGNHIAKEFGTEGGKKEGLPITKHHHTGAMKPARPFHFGNGRFRLGTDGCDFHQRAKELEANVSQKLEQVFVGSQK